jgi:ribulose-phosphate 3-epimerase
LLIDVHLNVVDPRYWAGRFIDVGADMITVHREAAGDEVHTILDEIAHAGARPAIGLDRAELAGSVEDLIEEVDRILVMGTELGVKGVEIDQGTFGKVRDLKRMCARSRRQPEVVVDGGIRETTIPALASAGADGVVPGSVVFGHSDPASRLRWIHSLPPAPPRRERRPPTWPPKAPLNP